MVVPNGIERAVAAIDEPAVEIVDVRPVPTLRIVALKLVIKDVDKEMFVLRRCTLERLSYVGLLYAMIFSLCSLIPESAHEAVIIPVVVSVGFHT